MNPEIAHGESKIRLFAKPSSNRPEKKFITDNLLEFIKSKLLNLGNVEL